MVKEREPTAREAFIFVGVVILIITPFFYYIYVKTVEKNEYCRQYGKRIVAFYVYKLGTVTSESYCFEFNVNSIDHQSSISSPFVVNPKYPYEEIPILVAYDEKDPDRNICLPTEAFEYRGYMIKWKKFEDAISYYMVIKKVK
ncbi:hypothetical protein DMA11_13905 [Marinilabiliaceae bacterium JC017]|nr:hypothetical protein DMA11_13905 [Marinilabiliaceae bacterium JC017]